MKRGFHRSDEAWYARSCGYDAPSFTIGMYDEEGGCGGEFTIEQDGAGLRLKSYSDSWAILTTEFATLLWFLAERGDKLTADELGTWLVANGVEDLTKRDATARRERVAP